MMAAPAFWSDGRGTYHPLALLLAPLGWLYGEVVAQKLARAQPAPGPIPTICVGNVSLGGVGKTPFSDLLAARLTALGARPAILLRGYGGKLKGPLTVLPEHAASDVGDEALMLAARWPVIVAADRAAGVQWAAATGANVVIMDDGFQNPYVHKDLAFLLIDAQAGLGNGRIFPAGPLREAPRRAFARADAVVMVESGPASESSFAPPEDLAAATFTARLGCVFDAALLDGVVHAFSGIGRPQKFFDDLARRGAIVARTTGFPDHHVFSAQEMAALRAAAAEAGAILATTEKDFARLPEAMRDGVHMVPARMEVDDPAQLDALLLKAIHSFAGGGRV